jgi:arylsulfatase A-like enzyme
LVELIDLAPTVLEAAGIDVPPGMQGASLAPLLAGDTTPAQHKPYVVSEYYDAIDKPNGTHATMYFDGRYKSAVYHGLGLGELYDLNEDPGEFRNLFHDAGSEKLVQDVLHKHLDALMSTVHPGPQRSGSY